MNVCLRLQSACICSSPIQTDGQTCTTQCTAEHGRHWRRRFCPPGRGAGFSPRAYTGIHARTRPPSQHHSPIQTDVHTSTTPMYSMTWSALAAKILPSWNSSWERSGFLSRCAMAVYPSSLWALGIHSTSTDETSQKKGNGHLLPGMLFVNIQLLVSNAFARLWCLGPG